MILVHFLLKWVDKLFHVETINNRHTDIQLKDNQKIYSTAQADVIYSKELGLAKTLFKENKASKKNALAEYLPHSETKFTLISIAYSFVRSLMFIYKYKMIKKYIYKKSKVLDFGSGTGDFLRYIKRKGHKAYGVEPNRLAREISKRKGIISLPDIKKLKETKFQAITMWHVLEHLPEPSKTVKSFHKILDKEGILIIAVPNLESFDSLHYKNLWAALDIPKHLWHFTSNGLIKIVETQGFKLVKIFPLWFDTLYISYLSEKNRSNQFPLLFGLFKGLYFNFKSFRTRNYSSLAFVFKKTTL